MGRFISIADLEQAVGPGDFLRLADPDNAGAADLAGTEAAIERAEGLVLSYVNPRARPGDLDQPAVIAHCGRLAIDIAIYFLARDPLQLTDDRRKRYEDALALLRDLATGKSDLPRQPLPAGTAPDGADLSGLDVLSAGRPRTNWSAGP